MDPLNRREFLAMAAAIPPMMQTRGANNSTAATGSGIFVCVHQASTARFDFRPSVEGLAKAGIRAVEVDLAKVRAFTQLPGESPATAKRLLDDLGIKAVSTSNHLGLPDAAATGVAAS